jgi:deoxyribose-phosphate aldolase
MAQPKAKLEETVINLQAGADEIDTVLNLGLLKSKKYKAIEEELSAIKTTMGEKILKVIIETCYLSTEEKRVACRLLVNSGVDFIKTSTGFGSGGATIEDVKLIKEEVGNSAKIKASGGIRDFHTAQNFIASGADRIGTSSGVSIIKNLEG